jgi:hypothetical protein
MAGKFVIKKSSDGQFRFNLKAGNGEIIGSSEGDNSEVARDNGISSVKANVPEASVVDETVAKKELSVGS